MTVTVTLTKAEAIDLLAALEASGVELPNVEQALLDSVYGGEEEE